MSMKHIMSQAGDTIVEVMFAVVIIGMTIGASYVVATRALHTGRFAQEQTEALKQAESQIEKLKYIASQGLKTTDTNYIFLAGEAVFCVNDTFIKVPTSDAQCKLRAGQYDVQVTYTAVPPAGGTDLFTVAVTWLPQGTTVNGKVQIAYRLHNAPAK